MIGDVRASASATWLYAEQEFGEETGASLAAGTLGISLLAEYVVPAGLRAASGTLSARGCFCFVVTEFPVFFDALVTSGESPDGWPPLISYTLPDESGYFEEPGTFDPPGQQLDPGSYCMSVETGHEFDADDGSSFDAEEAADITISYTIVPVAEQGGLACVALGVLAGLGRLRR
jgi:hypothetical protein